MTGLRLNAFISDWLMKCFLIFWCDAQWAALKRCLSYLQRCTHGVVLIAAGMAGVEKLPYWKVKTEDYVDIWFSPIASVDYKQFADGWGYAALLNFFLISYLIEQTFDQDQRTFSYCVFLFCLVPNEMSLIEKKIIIT